MLKLLKYLKPYGFIIFSIGVLLFLQVNLDLALPDLMSRIVNTGIQQRGIDSPVPIAVTKTAMNGFKMILEDEEISAISGEYFLIASVSELPERLRSVMPDYDGDAIYILRKDAETEKLETAFLKAVSFSIAGADEVILRQSALRMVAAEYEALGIDMVRIQSRFIMKTGSRMILFTLISIIANIAAGLFAARTAAGTAQKIRSDIFRKVEHFSGEEFDKFSTASLITRTTNDVTQVQLVIFMILRMVIFAPIMGVGGVIRALGKAPSMAWIIALAVLTLLGLIVIVFFVTAPRFKRIQKLIDRLNLVTRENLSGLMVVRSFNRQEFEEKRFDEANRELTAVNLFVTRVMVVMMPAMMLIMNLLSVTIIWVGAHQVAESGMQVGDMMAFLQYAMQIVTSFLMISMIFIFLPRAAVSGDRITEVLETELKIKDPLEPVHLPEPVKGRIEFRNVCFRYPCAKEDALYDISFTVEPGKTTAIIGSTGAGKSTLVNLIPRFYDVSGGEIFLDGVDIRNVIQKDLRTQIGYVPQKSILFSGSIESNLKYADENVTAEVLLDSAETAQALEFINARSEGFQTQIAQGGQNISGGQKQRLSIARALVKRAPIYIFDDSFSALDFKTDAALRKALNEKAGKSTRIIVAQRVSTIMRAEQIIVLDKGKLAGKGTHEQLMEGCEAYREIAYSQLSIKGPA